ncbi:hypothetical protein ASPWEDRAFT_119795 [Aspergillus wentii DTO 134E9]|uniref:Zn(2)-C6 fungal-type domain-containing protein n=1 Tax=Aspergillus wentii DTO 134E9 TaxID=1073089 RepID=A0A1L9R8L6_ASPWE|nr:uncharacterized protein ASPWEDRAFT_119795 [Aspergillus wentii DTO 134E9]KAI9925082.1 hypothetical protein MW887_006490 [Aspergillus wentii]OJJ31260.1 hypothetical protein ASPWEDRAFT_119795 [Aspergillus wentii DTO 134E9]
MAKTRTRSGCAQCRKSKVKCDEKKPICTRCHKKGFPCTPEEITLKWESDYHSRGLAFGRTGVWKRSSSSSDRQIPAQCDEQQWAVTRAVRPWSFLNWDAGALEQLYSSGRCAVPVRVRDAMEIGWSQPLPLTDSPSMFPELRDPVLLEYYVHHVCPRTTSSAKTASPFASVILPFCLNGSATVLKAIQALGACSWSQSNPAHIGTAMRLKSQVLQDLRHKIAHNPSFIVSKDPEVLVLMMMLSLYDIVDRCDKGWVVHSQGAKEIMRLRKHHLPSSASDDVTAFAELFFAFQDVMGRTACAKADLFGPAYWDEDDCAVHPWMGCSPALVSILFSILDLSRTRRQAITAPEQAAFSIKASAINCRLIDLNQVVHDPADESLHAAAQLKRLACTLYLHCSLYNADPSTPAVISRVHQILDTLSSLLARKMVVNAMWAIFVAAVELNPADDTLWPDPTGQSVCGRALILHALSSLGASSVSSVARTRSIIEKVWQARDFGSFQESADGCNDWEWHVVPLSDALSLV